jgi:hypothetical protein
MSDFCSPLRSYERNCGSASARVGESTRFRWFYLPAWAAVPADPSGGRRGLLDSMVYTICRSSSDDPARRSLPSDMRRTEEFPPPREVRVRGQKKHQLPSPHSSPIEGEDFKFTVGQMIFFLSLC